LSKKIVIRKNRYFDSVFLMRVAQRMASQPGIKDAAALLATPANRKLLTQMGYGDDGRDAGFASAGSNDLVIALEGDETAIEAIAADADSYLVGDSSVSEAMPAAEPRTIAEAVARRPDCSVAVISVPGQYAAREARIALERGLHVFLFSSNVSVEDELSLKTQARRNGLIVMGPDCGTAFLAGAGIGFANVVRRGPIGIVGSTGTGMQEFASLVHQAGSGISSGIGTGSRDLSDAIGGISTMTALEALESDPVTKVIAVLSKPPGAAAAQMLVQRLARCSKRAVLCLLGADGGGPTQLGPSRGSPPRIELQSAFTIDEVVGLALRAAGVQEPSFLRCAEGAMRERAADEVARMQPQQRHVRGLFAGGSLCYQAQAIFRRSGLLVYSNAPLPGSPALVDPNESCETSFVDMGAEFFVQGRPHPMIDASARSKRLEREAQDSGVAVILLDFILGAMASRDPVGEMLGAIRRSRDAVRARGGHLCIVASVCGTDEDVQGLQQQRTALEEAGVQVFASGAQAATFCSQAALLLAKREDLHQ
jgi:FdrA protein